MPQVGGKTGVAVGNRLGIEHHHDGGERLVVVDRSHAGVGAVGHARLDLVLNCLVGMGGKRRKVLARKAHDIRAVILGRNVGGAEALEELLAAALRDAENVEEIDGDGDGARGCLQRGSALLRGGGAAGRSRGCRDDFFL